MNFPPSFTELESSETTQQEKGEESSEKEGENLTKQVDNGGLHERDNDAVISKSKHIIKDIANEITLQVASGLFELYSNYLR